MEFYTGFYSKLPFTYENSQPVKENLSQELLNEREEKESVDSG